MFLQKDQSEAEILSYPLITWPRFPAPAKNKPVWVESDTFSRVLTIADTYIINYLALSKAFKR
jgi:hypothetical protein